MDRGSWIANSWVVDRGLCIAVLVSPCGWHDMVLGSTMEIGETEMRFGDEDWRDRDER